MERRRSTVRIISGACGVALIASLAGAQTNGTYLINVSGVASPSNPTVHVEVFAAWEDPHRWFVFGAGNYDLLADEGEFSNAVANPSINLVREPGTPVGNRVTAAQFVQLNILGFAPNLDNPLLLAGYEWTTSDFTPRTVLLGTVATSHFHVDNRSSGASTSLFPEHFTPGFGSIIVVPAPSAVAVCGIMMLWGGRRRL